jgi:hypothetical protein
VNTEALTLANRGLVERVNALSVQVAKQERILNLCFEFISNFNHFVPRMAQEFQAEIKKIEEDDYVDLIR